MPPTVTAAALHAPEPDRGAGSTEIRAAAEQFEALLLSQLLATMRRTVPEGMFGGGFDSQLWTSMLDEALSAQMARGGGIGLADVLSRQLDSTPSAEGAAAHPFEALAQTHRARQAYSNVNDPTPGRRAVGMLERVQEAAAELLRPDRAGVWGRDGQLTPRDLSNDFVTAGEDGVEGFNVLDANGFEDCYKCNLFAFELAYRSGLSTPIMGRGRGWGYMGPRGLVDQIESGRVDGRWATVADGRSLEEVTRATDQGVPFMMVGEGRDGRAGHVGIVDQVHRIERGPSGEITRIEYSGWEANGDGAHYRRRTWGMGRFASIHMLELRAPPAGQEQCFAVGGGPARPSLRDAPRFAAAGGAEEAP